MLTNNLKIEFGNWKVLSENQQYQRCSNIVISGIPSSIKDENVASTEVSILNRIDVPVSPRDVQAAHKNWKERTIIRFVNRKDAQAAISKRSTLKFLMRLQLVLIRVRRFILRRIFVPLFLK